MLKQISNKKGMSILEVMVAAGLASIVSLGVATMMQNSMTEQRRAKLMSTLKDLQTRIQFLARDQASWDQTVTATTSPAGPFNAGGEYNGTPPLSTMYQLRRTLAVSKIDYTNPEKIMLFDAAGNIQFNLLDWAGNGSNGFTENGGPCTTFSSVTGNDACPISYKLVMAAECPGAASSCVSPQFRIVGRLVFNPSSTGALAKFKSLVAVGSMSSISGSPTTNDGKYDAVVSRSGSQADRVFKITAYKLAGNTSPTGGPGGNSDCNSNGAGTCTNSPALHPLTTTIGGGSGFTPDSDPSSLANLTNASNGIFQFNSPGTYSCIISAAAFGTGGFTIYLKNTTTSQIVSQASTTAGQWSSSTANIDARFTVANITDQYSIFQSCSNIPGATGYTDAYIQKCSLGMALSPYATLPGTAIVTVSCTKNELAK